MPRPFRGAWAPPDRRGAPSLHLRTVLQLRRFRFLPPSLAFAGPRLEISHVNTNEITRFDQLGLSEKVLAAVAEMGYETPSPVQAGAIPAVLEGRDVMAAAQTGTGKTAAFLLPTLDRLGHAAKGQGVLMLVVTPTRELAQQIEACARVICKQTGHRCAVVVGGVGYGPQKDALARGCDVLIATPGRLIDLIEQGACDLSVVRVLVLDEADRMLDMGFAPAMRRIVAKTPDTRQTLLFSATLGEDVLSTTKALVKNPVRVEIAHKGTAAQTIDQYVLGVAEKEKVRILSDVLAREGSKRVIVFCRGKHRADMVCRKLNKAGFTAAAIHGNRSQSQRETALRRFANGEADVLVATDVLARGIDITDVSYVVNMDVPSDAEAYIHRIGRTGRAGEYGWALTFVSEAEYYDLRDVEQLMGKLIPDFPRTEGLDRGEGAFTPDPARKPTDKLPSKKARKKMAEQRAAGQAASAADGASAQVAGPREERGAQAGGRRRKAAGARQAGSCGTSSVVADKVEESTKEVPAGSGSSRRRSRGHRTGSDQDGRRAPERVTPARASAEAPERKHAAGSQESSRRSGQRAGAGAQGRGRGTSGTSAQRRERQTVPQGAQASGKPRRRPGDHGGPLAAQRSGGAR